jgi:inorganic pyrophosphatase/exopolyphosphatase
MQICSLVVFLVVAKLSILVTSMSTTLRGFTLGGIAHLKQSSVGALSSSGHTFVLGNEAADADSIISSLTYAFLKQWQCDNRIHSSSPAKLRNPFIPIVSISRKEIHLRRDVELLLNEVGLQLSDLICVDECNIANLTTESRLDLILVDLNVLGHELSKKIGSDLDVNAIVKEVLDHHEDSGAYLQASVREIAFDSERKIPEVASTCTIVAEKYLETDSVKALTEDIATLLVGVIALDSLNMNPSQRRGTPRDQRALDSLLSLHPTIRRNHLFELLMNAKTDPSFWKSLSASDAIRIDFKGFQIPSQEKLSLSDDESKETSRKQGSFGIASVLQSAESFLLKADLDIELNSYFFPLPVIEDCMSVPSMSPPACSKAPVPDMLVIMNLEFTPKLSRSLLFFSNSKDRIRSLSAYLCAEGEALQLQEIDSLKGNPSLRACNGGDIYVLAYEQGNTDMSRKQIAPFLSSYYSSTSNSP